MNHKYCELIENREIEISFGTQVYVPLLKRKDIHTLSNFILIYWRHQISLFDTKTVTQIFIFLRTKYFNSKESKG